ncbi:MAG TPA: SMEK domain-containing protein [Mucilaginibacter sp.]|jgi:hypothetical protein|nr:SMEK domain-containing protein [Mucilaginibacter sp.]
MSNHNKLLVSIRDYLARFQLQVKIATANSEYDINQHAENIIIPILNIAFDTQFKNVNETEKKNFESLDLISDGKVRIGIQVTSTRSLEKVKGTLNKFLKHGLYKSVDIVYIYVLTEKQRSYSQESIDEITKDKIKFNAARQIMDATDLYALIKSLNDVPKFQRINELLEMQFSDVKIGGDFNYADYASFRESYKEKCLNNFSRLNFFGLSVSKRPREVELYELFVPPLFRNNGMHRKYWKQNSIQFKFNFDALKVNPVFNERLMQELLTVDALSGKLETALHIKDFKTYSGEFVPEKFEDLFQLNEHLVILGNPGAGKSSTIKYSICKILEDDESIFSNNDIYRYMPFRIELHKYNQAKVLQNVSFADFLVKTLASEYQTNISLERMIKILTFFPCLLFFDGIDEIFDIQERINVRNDIKNFASSYPDARVVVTSRYESYEEVSFDDFYELEVNNFNQDQLQDYVHKWYKQEEPDANRRQQEIQGCLAQLEHVEGELKYNPLLLSLILILYRNELELPTNKLSIYEGCTNTIVEHRDEKEKKLKFSLQVNNKNSIFASIAFWQFDNSNRKINNTIVQRHVKDYLMQNGDIEDEHDAEKAAVEFLEFAKVRSIYFENKFTHKTFLEYFAAYYIFSKYYISESKQHFYEILSKNLGLSSWAVVLELLIYKIDSIVIEPKVMGKIIDEQLEKNKNDALLFFLQILKYLTNVNERMCVNLITMAIAECFASSFPLKESKVDHRQSLFYHLVSIYSVPRFQNAFIKTFTAMVKNEQLTDEQLISFAYEFSFPVSKDILIGIVDKVIEYTETPHLYLIRNFASIDSEEKYLEMLKVFWERFGIESLGAVYRSAFGQPIFFNSDHFNWILSFIFSVPAAQCQEQYVKLKSIGLSQTAIRRAINQKMLTKPMVLPYERLLYQLPKSGFRDFLQTLIKPLRRKQHEGEGKFYDKFYIRGKH